MKKNRSQEEYSLDIQVLLHPVVRNGNQFVLLAESFYPQYHTENYTDYDFYGRPYTNSYSIFDGYRFTSGIIAGFDRQGDLLWDNAMEIRNLLSFELTPKMNVFISDNEQIICYLSDGKIGSKIFNGNTTLGKTEYSPVQLKTDNDRLLSETKSRMIFWYDRYFLCYGFQEIKNLSREGENKRLVYYFTKIRIEN